MSKNLHLFWTKNQTSKEDKDSFEALVRNSTLVLGRVQDFLKEKETVVFDRDTSEKAYDNPNWHYLQAHRNGYLQAIKELNELLNFIPPDQRKIK